MAAPRTILLDKSTGGRYAQLTYTSFDDGAGLGGWQVKEVTGSLDAEQRQALAARIVTRFDLLPVMPDFPTPEQTAARPARLAYAVLDGATARGSMQAAYWHTVDAGRDASGRPGNVFAHVLLDREIAQWAPARPIELWRSPGWLRPYGVDEVAAARVTGELPPPANPDMSVGAIIDFLLAHHVDRQSVFRAMLDAVAGALAGGPALVLLADDHDDAARWIAAISHFMSPVAARRLGFCTHDGPDVAAASIEAGAAVVVVSRTRVEEYRSARPGRAPWEIPGAIVVDTAEQPNLGDLAGGIPHRVARGEIPVTPWSALAEGVLSDEEIATAVLARQDEVARELADAGAAPAWSLAVAVIEHPDLAEFAGEAMRVIADGGPPVADRVPWAKELVTQAQSRFPLTTSQALGRLVAAVRRGGADTSDLTRRFLRAVVADPHWLAGGALGDVPQVTDLSLDADDVAAVGERCAQLRRAAASDGAGVAIEALRLAEVVERCVRPGAVNSAGRAELFAVLTAVGGEFLWDAPDTVSSAELAEVSAAVRGTYVRPFVARESVQRIGQLTPLAARWLYDVPLDTGPRFEAPANPIDVDHYLFPLVVTIVLGHPDWRIPVPARRQYALDAVKLAVESERFDDSSCRDLVERLVTLQVPDVADLLALSNAYPRRVSPSVLATVVYCGAPDHEVMGSVLQAPDAGDALIAAATLRGWHASGTLPPRADWVRDVEAVGRAALDSEALGGEALEGDAPGVASAARWVSTAAPDLIAMVVAGHVLAQRAGSAVCAPDTAFTRQLAARVPDVARDVAALVRTAARSGELDVNWVAAQSFLRHLRLAWVPTLLEQPAFGGWRWDDEIVRQAVVEGTYRGPRSSVELRDAGWPTVASTSARTAERFFAGYRDGAHAWLAEMGLPAEHDGRFNRRWSRDERQP